MMDRYQCRYLENPGAQEPWAETSFSKDLDQSRYCLTITTKNLSLLASVKQPLDVFSERHEVRLRKTTLIRMSPQLGNIIFKETPANMVPELWIGNPSNAVADG
jgi:hypothetical protein